MSDKQPSVDDAADSGSKDECFEKVAAVADELVARHGKDFAMGTLILAARFIAEDKPLSTLNAAGPPTDR